MVDSAGVPVIPPPLWRRHRWAADLVIALVLMVVSSVWATHFWKDWTARVGRGVFYQTYFEPAVMIACGKGFVISHPQPKALEDFLFERVDRFDCSSIPADAVLNTRYLYQGAWRYLLVTVGWAWAVLGISWSGLGPLFGFWFGLFVALSYGIFRVGAGRTVAIGAALALALSSTQLLNLPHLRDFAKAPFTAALVLLLAGLIVKPVTRGSVIGLSAAYGIVLGIAYGFRTDFLINLPLLPAVVLLFLDGGLRRHLGLKAAGVAVFVIAFAIASWPITRAVYTSGGCQWHVTLLGLQAPFDDHLRISPAPYDYGHLYSDSYIDRTIAGFHWRKSPNTPRPPFCSPAYDADSGEYVRTLVKEFPADFIARAYASAVQIAELPFRALPPLPDWHSRIYTMRLETLAGRQSWGLRAAILAVLMVASVSMRKGIALLFLLAYFGGYPAVQFQERHYFHLEFIGWWAIAFVMSCGVAAVFSLRTQRPALSTLTIRLARMAGFAAVATLLAVGLLFAARRYQAANVKQLLRAYASAPKVNVESPSSPLPGIGPQDWPQLLEVNIDGRACASMPKVSFKYAGSAESNFDRTVEVSSPNGVTRIYQPVFEQYTGIDVSDASPGCLVAVSRVQDVTRHALLLGAVLPPNWENESALYQRLTEFEQIQTPRHFEPLPDVQLWKVAPGLSKSWSLFGAAEVEGDSSEGGYQITSPVVRQAPGTRIVVRVDVKQVSGHVCVGALDAGANSWLVSPTATGSEFEFTVDETGGFMVAIVNCNSTRAPAQSRFRVGRAEFAPSDVSRSTR